MIIRCIICGREFEAQRSTRTLCDDPDCRRKRKKITSGLARSGDDFAVGNQIFSGIMVTPGRCGEKEAEARKQGKHYADLQKEETLRLVGKIKI